MTHSVAQGELMKALTKPTTPGLALGSGATKQLPIIDSNVSELTATPTGLAPVKGAAKAQKELLQPKASLQPLPQLPPDGEFLTDHNCPWEGYSLSCGLSLQMRRCSVKCSTHHVLQAMQKHGLTTQGATSLSV